MLLPTTAGDRVSLSKAKDMFMNHLEEEARSDHTGSAVRLFMSPKEKLPCSPQSQQPSSACPLKRNDK